MPSRIGEQVKMSGQFYFSLLNPAIAFTFALVFLVLWRRFRGLGHMLLVVLAFIACGLAFVFRDFPVLGSETATLFATNLAFITSIALACAAALRLSGRPVPWAILAGVCAAGMAGFAYYLLVDFSTMTRAGILGVTMALCALVAMIALISARPLALPARMMLVALAIGFVLALVRPVLAVAGLLSLDDGDSFRQSSYWLTIQAFTPIFAGAIGMLFMAAISIDTFEQLRNEANHDYLTGLLNRRGFESAVTEALANDATGRPALLMADIDDFKKINDSFGHKAGDLVIAGLAQVLASHGNAQFAGRMGGEEFALFYPASDNAALKRHAEAIRNAAGRLTVPGIPRDYPVTLSIGIHVRSAGECLSDMLIESDRALYKAKTTGKDRAVTSVSLRAVKASA